MYPMHYTVDIDVAPKIGPKRVRQPSARIRQRRQSKQRERIYISEDPIEGDEPQQKSVEQVLWLMHAHCREEDVIPHQYVSLLYPLHIHFIS